MTKLSSFALVGLLAVSAAAVISGDAMAQSRTAPAGSSLANTPPIDQRAKQFRALPRTQKNFYLRQGYRRHVRPY